MPNTLKKIERLHGTADTENIFAGKKKSVFVHPLRVVYKAQEQDGLPTRIMVIVPKRYFKHAVDRNLLKRRLREAYRLNKRDLKYDIAFIYSCDEMADFSTIEAAVVKALDKISNIDK
jgi:ribonuclease P protein component